MQIYGGLYVREWPMFLKALDTIGNYQRPVFSLGVSQQMYTKKTVKFELNWSPKLWENNGRKIHLSHKLFMLSDALNSRPQLNSIQIFEWEITSFSKTTLLQREPLFTMCYTTNSSPLVRFTLTIVLSNNQKSHGENSNRWGWLNEVTSKYFGCYYPLQDNVIYVI